MTVTYEGGAVEKAYLGGGRYAPAVALGAKELRQTVRRGMYRPRPDMESGYVQGNLLRSKSLVQSLRRGSKLPPQTDAMAFKTGGKNDPGHIVFNSKATKRVVAHEKAHLSPKRTGWRFNQISANPTKTMREEARADIASGVYYRNMTKDVRHALAGNQRVARKASKGSAYAAAATSEKARAEAQAMQGIMSPMSARFSRENVAAYRQVQDKIARAQGVNATRGRNKPREVAKAYLGGGKYAPATALGAKKLRQTVQRGMYRPGPRDEETRRVHQNVERSRFQPYLLRNKIQTLPPGMQGMAFKAGGKKDPGEIILAPGAPKRIVSHEKAHLSPKRTGWRFGQINSNPTKTMREEARADMAAGTYYRNKVKDTRHALAGNKRLQRQGSGGSAYAVAAANDKARANLRTAAGFSPKAEIYDPENVAAYRQVQDKIAAARGVPRGVNKPRDLPRPKRRTTPRVPENKKLTLYVGERKGVLGRLGGRIQDRAVRSLERKGYQVERVHKAILKPLKPPAMGIKTPKAPKPFTGAKLPSLKPKKPAGVKLPQLPKPPRPGY